MAFARVVIDVATRSLMKTYDYAVPDELAADVAVGSTVLVSFGGRKAVGYVVGMGEQLAPGLSAAKVRSLEAVLAEPAFDQTHADLALWMAHEYAAPPSMALRLFLAPGQTIKTTKGPDGWQLVNQTVKAPKDRWVELTEAGASYTPRANALRQREVLDTLALGPQKVSDLAATIRGVRPVLTTLEKRGIVAIFERRHDFELGSSALSSAKALRPETLTAGQAEAVAAIRGARARGGGACVLVDGVCGSGKTEVYLRAIEETLKSGKGAIVLVPEISLTAQTVGRFRSRFGEAVSILHSRLSTSERLDQWEAVRQGQARVVVGARSALFAPLKDIGLIIIDEEHEHTYKQDSAPRYHAREVAAKLAKMCDAALVLGSATPSLEALERAEQGSWDGAPWERRVMPERPAGAVLPTVEIVDMRAQFAAHNNSPISEPLREALLANHAAGHKSVLLLNRRGFANFLMCRTCGCVPTCDQCSTSLTYHEAEHALICHTCGRSWSVLAYPSPMAKCPRCGGPYLASYGVGTERVEAELKALLPRATIVRMDADSTRTKGAHETLLEQFDRAPASVLIGTQMIAKGLDFPEVTLVGVINADSSLKMPDFRAPERTAALLEQVAGRAGRSKTPGHVIVQTYWPEHLAITALKDRDRHTFVSWERAERQEAYYPPFSRLGRVVVTGKNQERAFAAVNQIADRLRAYAEGASGWRVLGPSECLKAKVKERFRFQVLIKAPVAAPLGDVLLDAARDTQRYGVTCALDVDAYDMM